MRSSNIKLGIAGMLAAMSLGGYGWAQTAQTNEPLTLSPLPLAAVPAAARKIWTDYITIKGDVRLRYETINDDAKKNAAGEDYTRDRARIRARLGAEAKLDDLKAGIRFSTGGADPVSGNQTLGDGDAKKEIRLDLAYLEYNFFGDNPYELKAIGGKMNNPLITFPDDLVWDPDLTPEGVAAKARFGNDFITLLLNGEGLYIQERADKKNTTELGGQAALQFQFMPEIGLTLGGAYLAFQNLEGYDVID